MRWRIYLFFALFMSCVSLPISVLQFVDLRAQLSACVNFAAQTDVALPEATDPEEVALAVGNVGHRTGALRDQVCLEPQWS